MQVDTRRSAERGSKQIKRHVALCMVSILEGKIRLVKESDN